MKLFQNKKSKTISRVMSCVIIYLEYLSPDTSSNQPEAGGPRSLRFGLASNGVYMASAVTSRTVVSYTAFPPLPSMDGGISLLH